MPENNRILSGKKPAMTGLPLFNTTASFGTFAEAYMDSLSGKVLQSALMIYNTRLSMLAPVAVSDIRSGDIDAICGRMFMEGCHASEIRSVISLFRHILYSVPSDTEIDEGLFHSLNVGSGRMNGPTHIVREMDSETHSQKKLVHILEDIANNTRNILEAIKALELGKVEDLDDTTGTITLEEVYRRSL